MGFYVGAAAYRWVTGTTRLERYQHRAWKRGHCKRFNKLSRKLVV